MDEWLFGGDLSDRVKNTKDLEQSSKDLRQLKVSSTAGKGSGRTQGNFKSPSRFVFGSRRGGLSLGQPKKLVSYHRHQPQDRGFGSQRPDGSRPASSRHRF